LNVNSMTLFVVRLVVLAVMLTPQQARGIELQEASGITRLEGNLLIVSDKAAGTIYSYPMPAIHSGALPLEEARIASRVISQGTFALDLESIGILADGRVVLLSERLRALVGEEGVIAQYGAPLSEFGNRGLEGLAILSEQDGHSRVAVLWEGGYPEREKVPAELQALASMPLSPVVWVHEILKGESRLQVRDDRPDSLDKIQKITLKVPVPDAMASPQGQRFRAPDLVWHTWGDAQEAVLGFIVLLSSENAPHTGPRHFRFQRLQRFTLDGTPVGTAIHLDELMPDDLRSRNWEGLGWLEPGERLILIHDAPPPGTPVLYILPLPPAWKCVGKEMH
jgi:hypothetical protein